MIDEMERVPIEETPGTEPESATAARRRDLAEAVNRIAQAMVRDLPAGDLADLRRLSPREPGGAAFFKLAVGYLRPRGYLTAAGASLDREERQWACVIAAMARAPALHAPGWRLGRSLAAASFSELRLVRLLRAHDDALLQAVRLAGQFLAAKGEAADFADLARLVLSDGTDHEEAVRRTIARDYYGHVAD